jgi:hypothetical protein
MNTPDISHLTKTELERLACLQSAPAGAAAIGITADDGRTYLFASAHYLDGVYEASSGKDANGSPERLVLRFTTGEVVVLGTRLGRIMDKLAEGHLRALKTVAPRYASAVESGPIISSLAVTRKVDV